MHNRGGFTIIEVMIVLTITGVMFTAAMVTMSQRLARTDFVQGVRETEALIRDVLNDVSNGHYPDVLGLQCSAPANSSNPAPVLTFDSSSTTSTIGRRGECVFAGKVLVLGEAGDAGSLTTYTMAGRRTFTDGITKREVTNFSELKPVVVDVAAGMVVSSRLPSGIKVINNSGSDYGKAVGLFFTAFKAVVDGQQISGTTGTSVANVSSGALNQNAIKAAANSLSSSSFISSGGRISICLQGGTDQVAAIHVRPGIQGAVETEIFSNLASAGAICN